MHVPRRSDLEWLGWSHEEIRAEAALAKEVRDEDKQSYLDAFEDHFAAAKQNTFEVEAESNISDEVNSDSDQEIVLKSDVGPDVIHSNLQPKDQHSPCVSAHKRGGDLVTLVPLSLVDSSIFVSNRKSLAVEPKEGVMGLVLPSSVLATSWLLKQGKTSTYLSDTRLIQRGGLFASHDVNLGAASASLYILKGSFAYRSRKFVVLTELKELFWMPLPPLPMEAEPTKMIRQIKPPVKVGVDVKAVNVNVTFLSVGDVFMKFPSDHLSTNALRGLGSGASYVCGGLIGNWTIAFAGDSVGNIHFFLTNDEGVVQQGQFQAYNSSNPAVSVLMTGDSMRPLWRIGVTNVPTPENSGCDNFGGSNFSASGSKSLKLSKGGSKNQNLRCISTPGSALVTVAKDGEVKVWQPVFTQLPKSKANVGQLLNIFTITWKMSGTFTGLGDTSLYISSACLDPTCMTVMLSTSNGFLMQWPLPGLVDCNSSALSTTKDALFSCRRHDTSISSMRVWVHSPKTSVSDVVQSGGARSDETSRFAALIRGPLSGTIGYTTNDLKNMSGNSTLVTSSTDYSMVLWRFMLSKVCQGPDVVGVGCRYLSPTPCKRLFFSSIPRDGICFPVPFSEEIASSTVVGRGDLKTTGSTIVWRVTALLNGVAANVAESPFYNLLDTNGFNGEQTGATLESRVYNSDIDNGDEDYLGGEEANFCAGELEEGTLLQMISTSGAVLKPSRLAVLTPKQIDEKNNSWALLNTDWLHRNVEDQANTQLETSLLGVGQLVLRPEETGKISESIQELRPVSSQERSRAPSPKNASSISGVREKRIPDHKVDIGVDEDISIMTGIRLPSDSPGRLEPARNDGLLAVMKNGFRMLVTSEQADNISKVIATSTDENNRMVYISPEKPVHKPVNPVFDMELSQLSSLNTPFLKSGAPEPLSPLPSRELVLLSPPACINRIQSMEPMGSPGTTSISINCNPNQSPKYNQSRQSSSPLLISTPTHSAKIDDRSIDLHSSPGEHSSVVSPSKEGKEVKAGKSVVGRVPSMSSHAGDPPTELVMTPKATLDAGDNNSVDSEFDPAYIETTMSLMSSSTGKADLSASSLSKGKKSKLFKFDDTVCLNPKSPVTPSKIIKPEQEGGNPVSLPMDDEAPVVLINTDIDSDNASEITDLDTSFNTASNRKSKHKVTAAEKRTQNVKYVSKPRAQGPAVKGKVVLQPFKTPQLGFVPSKNFFEQKIEEGQKRVVVKKKPTTGFGVTNSAGQDVTITSNKSCTAVGLVGDGINNLVLGESKDFKREEHYFDWSSEPLFVLRVKNCLRNYSS